MPLYEYCCRACGHRFEVLQRMGEDGEGLRCPACASAGADRQLSTFAGRSAGSQAAAAAGGCAAPGCGSGFT